MTSTTRTIILSLIAASTLSVGSLQSAQAQGRVSWSDIAQTTTETPVQHVHHRELRRKQVRRILRQNGFRNIHDIHHNGRVYVAKAVTHRGHDARVRVHARTGEILSVRTDRVGNNRPVRRTVNRLRNRGFYDFSQIKYRNDLAIFRATNRHGERIKFKIDRYSGQVVKRKFVGYDQPVYKNHKKGKDFTYTSPDGSFSFGLTF